MVTTYRALTSDSRPITSYGGVLDGKNSRAIKSYGRFLASYSRVLDSYDSVLTRDRLARASYSRLEPGL